MKSTYLRKKIIIHFSASAVLVLVSCFSIYYRLHQEQKSNETINKIRSQTAEIEDQTETLKSKIIDVKRYKEIWGTLTESKKNSNGIKIDDINFKLDTISQEHNIYNPVIKVSFPENLTNGIFAMSTTDIVCSSVNLSFFAISDIEALLFISELTKSLPGYVVIKKLSIQKLKKYSESDLAKISSGEGSGAISSQVDFYWYVYKPKTDLKNDQDTNNNEDL
jgi:cell division protein FtsL